MTVAARCLPKEERPGGHEQAEVADTSGEITQEQAEGRTAGLGSRGNGGIIPDEPHRSSWPFGTIQVTRSNRRRPATTDGSCDAMRRVSSSPVLYIVMPRKVSSQRSSNGPAARTMAFVLSSS